MTIRNIKGRTKGAESSPQPKNGEDCILPSYLRNLVETPLSPVGAIFLFQARNNKSSQPGKQSSITCELLTCCGNVEGRSFRAGNLLEKSSLAVLRYNASLQAKKGRKYESLVVPQIIQHFLYLLNIFFKFVIFGRDSLLNKNCLIIMIHL